MAARGSKEDAKTRIIDSAKKLFAEQGFLKTTVVDICRQAGLSEAALYEYFQGKEDLLLTIPQLWVSDLIGDLKEQLFGIKGAVNKLRKFLWWNLRRIEQAPLDAKIVYLFLKTNANFLQTEVYANVRDLYSHLIEIFEEGRATGEMRSDLNPYLARDIIVGTMDHIVIRWLLKDMSYSIFDNLEETFQLMVDGFRTSQATLAVEGQNMERAGQEEGVNSSEDRISATEKRENEIFENVGM
ncbi:MAG: TetR/AcrR family transcriptional regulator [Deltaproteobacteria bacterium]|nr:TetR/AcrR family transcriptional regulator [Deltaproteobacteria bacterium]